jgi:hypothetical protein
MNASTGLSRWRLPRTCGISPRSCMVGHPDVGAETPQQAQTVLTVGRWFWILRRCQHSGVAYAHDAAVTQFSMTRSIALRICNLLFGPLLGSGSITAGFARSYRSVALRLVLIGLAPSSSTLMLFLLVFLATDVRHLGPSRNQQIVPGRCFLPSDLIVERW